MTGRLFNGPIAAHRLREEMDRMFGEVFPATGVRSPFTRAGFPALNAWEDKEGFYVEAEVPGLTLEDLEIFVKGNELTITGERKVPNLAEGHVHRRERGEGKFARGLRLPTDVDADKVQARLRDGVLTLMLPKAENAKPRKIEVRYQ